MCEVTIFNFNDLFNEIEEVLKKSAFISIDCEFSALYLSNDYKASLFDTPCQRYIKMRKNLENSIPLEIGITAFSFDRDNALYVAKPYTFYVFPIHFGLIDKNFSCQSSAFHFLCEHKFDFNKVFYSGIPYLNKNQEEHLQKYINNNDLYRYCKHHLDNIGMNLIQTKIAIINKWITLNKNSNEITLLDSNTKNWCLIYLLHKEIRNKFGKKLWTYQENEKFKVKRVTPEEYTQLNNKSLENNLFTNLLGFTRIYRLLVSLKKPIVGHNFLYDLLLLVNTFDNLLPESYTIFKQKVQEQFPSVYDTKTISFDVSKSLSENPRWKGNGLQDLYEFLKHESDKHAVPSSPKIQIAKEFEKKINHKFHDAGWDAYCTGYCFIQLAHYFAIKDKKVPRLKVFLSTEHIKAVECFKNQVNIIRATIPYLNFSGEDPKSLRPSRLIIQSKNRNPIDIIKVTELLREYGSLDIQPYSHNGRKVLAAVANFKSVKRIVKQFENHKDFMITRYSIFKHSPVFRAAFWASTIVSGSFLAWYVMKN